MSYAGVAVALVGFVVTVGCGRIGFGPVGDVDGGRDGSTASGDGDGGDALCIASSVPITASPTPSEFPALSWNGTQLGVTWIEDPTGTPSGHFRTTWLGGPADPIVNLGVPGPTGDLDVAWDGASWRLAWSDGSGTDREIVRSTNGAPAQAITANARTDLEVRMVSLSVDTTAYLWMTDANRAGYDLMLAVLDASGTKLVNDLTIATGLGAVEAHDLVWTGSELVVFYATAKELVMLRMSSNGSTIAGPIPIATEAVSSDVSANWIGDRFLVAWYSASGVRIAYVSRAGALLFPIMSSPVGPVLSLGISSAIGPTSDMVVWDDIGTGSAYLLPVARDGTLGTPVTLPQTGSITAAWVGTTWAIAASQGPMPRDIYLHQLCP